MLVLVKYKDGSEERRNIRSAKSAHRLARKLASRKRGARLDRVELISSHGKLLARFTAEQLAAEKNRPLPCNWTGSESELRDRIVQYHAGRGFQVTSVRFEVGGLVSIGFAAEAGPFGLPSVQYTLRAVEQMIRA